MMGRYDAFLRVTEGFRAESRLRSIPAHRRSSEWLDLTSNDYMGLASREYLFEEFLSSNSPLPSFSASASRLLALNQENHGSLEDYLESLYRRPALLFNSGYHANTGIISALNLPGTLFVADKLIHASMIDGLKMGRCEFLRFPHNDMAALERILAREAPKHDRMIVLAESIYSMDGDMGPLATLTELRHRYGNMILYVDEAHGFGVRGEKGLGLAEELGLLPEIDILIGTLGKAACSSGAFCVADRTLIDYFINTARSFIFSTALPPVNQVWSRFTIGRLTEMNEERKHLRGLSRYFRSQLQRAGFDVPDGDSPIVPLVTGDAAKAVILSGKLKEEGILALPIRRPTVPPGGERLRFSLSAALLESDIDRVIKALVNK